MRKAVYSTGVVEPGASSHRHAPQTPGMHGRFKAPTPSSLSLCQAEWSLQDFWERRTDTGRMTHHFLGCTLMGSNRLRVP